MNPASSIPYGTLTQTNPSHDSDRHRRWAALYEGDLTTDDKRDLLPRRLREPHALWLDRVRHGAEYIGYFGALVVAYAQTVCHAPLRVGLADGSEPDADYSAFAEQASEGGDSFAAIAESVLADALVHGRGYLAIDAPRAPDGVEVLSRAHEDALGLSRITADRVDPCAVIDWAAGADGYLDWCVIHRVVEPRDGARDVRDRVVEHFRYWYRDESTGLACWADYAITRKRTKRISPRAEVPLVDAGATSFLHVPMVPLVLKPAQWLGAKLAPLAGEVFRRRSELAAGMAHSIAATPVLKLGPEIPKMGEGLSEAQQDPHRGRNYGAVAGSGDALILGAEDDAKFLEPAGAAWKLGADEIRRLVDEMFRIAGVQHSAPSNTDKALHRSGESKKADREATNRLMAGLGADVREWGVRVYDVMAAARSEDAIWSATGCDVYESDDREQIVAEAAKMADIAVPSPTFQRHYLSQMAKRLLDEPAPDVLAQIEAEIETAVARETAAIHAALDHVHDADEGDDIPDEVA